MRIAGTFVLMIAVVGAVDRFVFAEPGAVDVPSLRDGEFFVKEEPAFGFTATLIERWTSPHAEEGTLHAYAPIPPELPGQRMTLSKLAVKELTSLEAHQIVELGQRRRHLLELAVPPNRDLLKQGVTFQATYEGTLYRRSLQSGKPPHPVTPLTDEQRRRYLAATETVDFNHPVFREWMGRRVLIRGREEDAIQFGRRVFAELVETARYGGDTSNYAARKPSNVCRTMASDCGGLALLFVAVMRSNGIPARTLFGRWSLPQTGTYGQFHVTAEFFVADSGWVPVDVSGTVVHQPKDKYAYFGNADGQHLAFHVDADLEPAPGFRHAWAQYLLIRWDGKGDFWKDHRQQSEWNVERREVHNREP